MTFDTTDFQLFHQNILDLYLSDLPPVDKWTSIATYMHQNSPVVNKTFLAIKKEEMRKDIRIDYETDFKLVQKQIAAEKNSVVKTSYLVLSLHQMIYHLMSQEGNYYLSLDGQNEMAILKKKLIYYINISSKAEQNIFFHAFLMQYALESLFDRHLYVGIDFEYTNKKIQLAQLNFEHNMVSESIVMIVRPNDLEPVMTNDFVELIICNKYIKKILHGSDSLDIPYMYNFMLESDTNKIRRFTRTLIDTRFLCEYYKISQKQGESEYRCSLYNEQADASAVFYFGVVNEEQQQKLSELLQNLPPPFDIAWNFIGKLPQSQIIYAAFDVIFLKYLYYRIIYLATLDESTDAGKKSVIDLYKHVLNEITRLVYLERNGITFLLSKCKEEIDPVNNYFIRPKTGGILKMIDIYNKISQGLETTSPRVNIDKLAKVNHFKIPILTIIKRLIYGYVSQKCRVQKDRATIWTDKLDNQFVFDFLEKMEYFYLQQMFKELDQILRNRVREICFG